MVFKSAQDIIDCPRNITQEDRFIFPSNVGELRFKMYSYRPKVENDMNERDAISYLCQSAGITSRQLLELARDHYSVDSYDESNVGVRWPERNNDHSNNPEQMTNMIIKLFQIIERKAKSGRVGTHTATKPAINSGALVITGVVFGPNIPDLSINVR